MNRRMVVIGCLAIAAILVHAANIYRIFIHPTIGLALSAKFDMSNGYFSVAKLAEDTPQKPSPLARAGIKEGDRIYAVYDSRGEGTIINNRIDIYEMIDRRIQFGEPWKMVVLRQAENNQYQQLTVQIPAFDIASFKARLDYTDIGFYIILPIIALITAFFMGFMRPKDNHAFTAFLLFLAFSTVVGIQFHIFPPGLRFVGILFNSILNSTVVYLFMRFFLLFPSPSIIEKKAPWLKNALLVFALFHCTYHLIFF